VKLGIQNLYECLCAALRRPLCQCGAALVATLKDQTPEDIAGALRQMTDDEATLLFNWLEDERAVDVLAYLSPETTDYILHHAPPGRLANLDLSTILPILEEASRPSEE